MTDQVADMIDELLAPGPGNILTNARQDRGLTVREVADKLHLLPRQVEALEANDYQQFNGEIFCKGYLKAYATLLDIDAEPLIAAYMESRPATMESAPTARPRAQIQRPAKGHSIQYWSLAATVLVIIVLWLMGSGDNDEVLVTVAETPEVVVDKNIDIAVEASSDTSLTPEFEMTVADESSPIIEQTAQPDEPEEPAVVELPEQPKSLSIDGNTEDTLRFSFTQDCWVEVKDGSGKMIFADLRRANDTLELNGVGPFNVLLGYAPGVTLDYNGEPVNVVVNRKKDSARLLVGE